MLMEALSSRSGSRQRRRVSEPIDWSSYDKALVERGNISIWFSDEAIAAWHPVHGGTRGGQRDYSDGAIETALTVRLVFKQALRQTEGLVQSLIDMMGLELKAPDHTTLSRRGGGLAVQSAQSRAPGESITLVVDGTGLKVYGQGEWDAAKHGRKKHRRWRGLHLCINERDLSIVSHVLATEETGDSTALPDLLDDVEGEVDELLGDGAYDGQPVYDRVEGHAAGGERRVTVPPRKNAKPSKHAETDPTQRDAHVAYINEHGRHAWEAHAAYHRRLTVENAMYRYKTIIGRHMHSRELGNQKTEAALGCKILNRMADIGLPQARCAV
jgi:hypothetical protein